MELVNAHGPPKEALVVLHAERSEEADLQKFTGTLRTTALEIEASGRNPVIRSRTRIENCTIVYKTHLELRIRREESPMMNWIDDARRLLFTQKYILVVRHKRGSWDTASKDFLYHSNVTLVGRNCCSLQRGSILVFTADKLPAWIQLSKNRVVYRLYWTDGLFPPVVGRMSRDVKFISIGEKEGEVSIADYVILLGGGKPFLNAVETDESTGERMVSRVQELMSFRPEADEMLRRNISRSPISSGITMADAKVGLGEMLIRLMPGLKKLQWFLRNAGGMSEGAKTDSPVQDRVLVVDTKVGMLSLLTTEEQGAELLGQGFNSDGCLEMPGSRLMVLVSAAVDMLEFADTNNNRHRITGLTTGKLEVETSNETN